MVVGESVEERKWQAEAVQADVMRDWLARVMLVGLLRGVALEPLLALWTEANTQHRGGVVVADIDIYARNVALELRRLRNQVDRVLAGGRDAGMPIDAVNVADLRCIETALVVDDTPDGAPMWRVVVAEAAPDTLVFREWLSDQLCELGWDRVEIVTEW